MAQGSKLRYGCLAAHRRDPTSGGYKQHHQDITGTSKVSKRRRKIDIVHL
jgi:IS5 family transposase